MKRTDEERMKKRLRIVGTPEALRKEMLPRVREITAIRRQQVKEMEENVLKPLRVAFQAGKLYETRQMSIKQYVVLQEATQRLVEGVFKQKRGAK